MTYACTIEESATERCVVCPEQPFVAPVPTVTLTDQRYGWNASAYSQTRLEGDVYTQFTLPRTVGTVLGLARERVSSDPRDLAHAFYVYAEAGAQWWAVSENGVLRTTPVLRSLGDVFRIERRNGTVRYFVNGRQVYASSVPSTGSVVVVACLYAAGDGVN